MAEYEYRDLSLPLGTNRRQAHDVLVIHAQFGEWELARTRIWPNGRQRVTLRRRLRRGELPLPFAS